MGKQTIVMTGGVFKDQSYLLSESAPMKWLQEKWDAGFRITDWTGLRRFPSSLNDTIEEHLMVVSKVPNLTAQTYFFEKSSEKYPEAWVRERQEEGYRLSSCGYVQNSWASRLSNHNFDVADFDIPKVSNSTKRTLRFKF